MGGVVSCIETRAAAVKSNAEQLEVRVAAMESKLDETKNLLDATRRDLDTEKASTLQLRNEFIEFKDVCTKKFGELDALYKTMAERMNSLVTPLSGNSSANAQSPAGGNGPPPANCNADLPYELRTCAKICNFLYMKCRKRWWKQKPESVWSRLG